MLRKNARSDSPPPRKQPRKSKNPARFAPNTESGLEKKSFCKNSECKAALNPDSTFCTLCSCLLCHLYDENKDPSLWLACTRDSGVIDACGMVCHLECALQHGKAGVVKFGPSMQLDGSYCCVSCGKVSSIIGLWKEQLLAAKEAQRLDTLCRRLSLSYKMLEDTLEFKELQTIVEEARHKLELELGPLENASVKKGHTMISRLSVCNDVQMLFSAAIEAANVFLNSNLQANVHPKGEKSSEACNIRFENASPTALLVVINESMLASDAIKEFKVWLCKVDELPHQKAPTYTFAKGENKFEISDLQPDTEYAVRIVPVSDEGSMGLFEARCFTKKMAVFDNKYCAVGIADGGVNAGIEISSIDILKGKNANDYSDLNAIDVGEVVEMEQMQENKESDVFVPAVISQCSHEFFNTETSEVVKRHSFSRELDLNVELVPDLNEEVPTLDSTIDEDNQYASWPLHKSGKDTIHDVSGINGDVKSDDEERARWTRDMPAVESRTQLCRKVSSSGEVNDDNSTFINGRSYVFDRSNLLDETYEQCLKAVRCLERGGHIKLDFRVKFFTWLGLYSTEQERKVVVTYIKTLEDDPDSLAGQLLHSFGETIVSKRPKNSLDNKLWK